MQCKGWTDYFFKHLRGRHAFECDKRILTDTEGNLTDQVSEVFGEACERRQKLRK